MNTEKTYPVIVTVPALFYADHRNRECGSSGVVIKSNKKTVTVILDLSAWQDLHSDAEYYASFKGTEDYYEDNNKSLCESAIRTLARLNK